MSRLAAALLAALLLAGCGRAGPPKVPGPKEEVIYPKAYPRYVPLPAPQGPPAPK